MPELAEAGVKRISLATSLYRAAMTGLLNAAREVKEQGTLGYVDYDDGDAGAEWLHGRVNRANPRLAPCTRCG